ncbi:MAG: hypothetical protein ACJA0X_002217 [Cyclobacteriaceae bacterium]
MHSAYLFELTQGNEGHQKKYNIMQGRISLAQSSFLML